MKHFYLSAVLALILMIAPVQASAAVHEDIVIKVNGMVCDFCAQSVWKVLEDYEGVNDIEISLDHGTVTVHMEPDMSLTEEELNEAITYAGYDLVSIEREMNEHK